MSDPGEENLPRFFADCMLGRLARWLRALGCDTLYERAIDDNELLHRCRDEARVLLTRDNELAHRGGGLEVLFIESESTAAQLKQVMRAFGLQICEERLFSRCTHCNNPVEELPKEKARGRVPPFVYAAGERFTYCPKCDKIYWGGTHKQRFLAQIGAEESQ